MTVYGLHGLRIRSEVALAGFVLPEEDWDLDVRWGPAGPVPSHAPAGRVVAARTIGDRLWYGAAEVDGEMTLRVPGMCDFVIARDLRSVECRPDPGTTADFVGVLAAGLVVAFVLGLAGHGVLHASAVEAGGAAIALTGDSGAGKSTLAAVLCAAGAAFVTDDVLRVGRADDGTVVCVGGTPQLRLRSHGAWALDRFATPPRATTTPDERLGIEPPAYQGPPLPLATIALIRPSRSASVVQLQRVTGAALVLRLARSVRVAGWKDATILRRQFETIAWVARSVRVVEAVVPWGPPLADGVAPALLELAAAE